METLTQEQIKEIAENLELGLKCFWCKQTNELLFVPDLDAFIDGEEFFEEELEKLESRPDDFVEIESMRSRDSFKIMEGFTERLDDSRLKLRLQHILSEKKPFKNFNSFIHHSNEEIRNQWFAFRSEKYLKWVRRQVEGLE